MRTSIYLLPILLLWAACSGVSPHNVGGKFQEQHRPQFHFTPPSQWMNDPNGMVYYQGEYHLFYQHYPDSNVWGPMHWGHAVSQDLVNWEHLPIALYPDSLGLIFSGSAVIDWKNTSGLGSEEQPPMIAIFTHHNMKGEKTGKNDFQFQSIAYSTDKGRTWTKYEGNPVIKNPGIRDFRDPKVIWYEKGQKWVMVFAAKDRVSIYSSPNLIDWNKESDFGANLGAHGGVWECPDLFPMYAEDSAEQKWVMLVSINPGGPNGGSATQYFVGDFDGTTFTHDEASMPKRNAEYTPNGTIIADFENGYADWKVEGEAFGKAPAKGALANQNPVLDYVGDALVNSFEGGDATTGKLTSPEFTIGKDYINFKIGGGAHQDKTCVNLIVEGKVLASTTGANNEILKWFTWHVEPLKGKTAKIEIIDEHTGGWGHINADHFVQDDEPAINKAYDALWLDWGRDNYAGVTWSDVPASDGRRLFIGWMSNWDYATVVPTTAWRSAMTISRTLSLKKEAEGYRLYGEPVEEMKKLRSSSQSEKNITVQPMERKKLELLAERNGTFELQLDVDLKAAKTVSFELVNVQGEQIGISYSAKAQELTVDRTKAGISDFSSNFSSESKAPLALKKEETLQLQILVDKSSVEVFANGGRLQMTNLVFPNADYDNLFVTSSDEIEIKLAEAWTLKSIWK